MQQRPLGRSGLAVSRLALGTMTWGRGTDPHDAAAQLKFYLEAGGTLIDTADVYGDGDAEAVIGSLIDHLVPREEVLIATKAGLGSTPCRRRGGAPGGGADPHQGGAGQHAGPPPGRLARAPAALAGRVAAPAGHRLRRPVA